MVALCLGILIQTPGFAGEEDALASLEFQKTAVSFGTFGRLVKATETWKQPEDGEFYFRTMKESQIKTVQGTETYSAFAKQFAFMPKKTEHKAGEQFVLFVLPKSIADDNYLRFKQSFLPWMKQSRDGNISVPSWIFCKVEGKTTVELTGSKAKGLLYMMPRDAYLNRIPLSIEDLRFMVPPEATVDYEKIDATTAKVRLLSQWKVPADILGVCSYLVDGKKANGTKLEPGTYTIRIVPEFRLPEMP